MVLKWITNAWKVKISLQKTVLVTAKGKSQNSEAVSLSQVSYKKINDL